MMQCVLRHWRSVSETRPLLRHIFSVHAHSLTQGLWFPDSHAITPLRPRTAVRRRSSGFARFRTLGNRKPFLRAIGCDSGEINCALVTDQSPQKVDHTLQQIQEASGLLY
ncbi:hypothetical protein AOLI_G00040900 [Acnodon oligacanthus]